MAQTTKRALAASLKKILAVKPLNKITVVDIVSDCEVNRQTFYYHFRDIYDLMEWILADEAVQVIGSQRTYATWQQGYGQIFQYVSDNRDLVRNAYQYMNREYLERFLYDMTYKLLIDVVEEKAVGLKVREADKHFIADFYKYAFVGQLLEWIRTGMREDASEIVARTALLIEGDFVRALEKYAVR